MASRNFKSAAMYGISRAIGHRDGPGWNVAVKRNGVRFAKSFPFSRFGGEGGALIQAQAWRDEIVKTHPPASRQQRANQLRSTNKTGIPGVTCILGPDGKPRTWTARTQISPDKTLQAKFSIARYGPEAKLLAIAARQKQLQQLPGLAFVHPLEAVVREAARRPIPPDIPVPLAKAEIVRSTNKSGVSGVRRVEARDRSPAYWGAITASGDSRKSLAKFFSIKTHGEEKAKELAIAERQRQLQQMADLRREDLSEAVVGTALEAPSEHIDRTKLPRVRNSSGIVGVSLRHDVNGQPTWWIARKSVGAKTVSESFSVKVHGFEQAKALAVAAREGHLRMRAKLLGRRA